jgi:hypothetical protein
MIRLYAQPRLWFIALLLSPVFLHAEVFQYEASYKGVLTGGKKFSIASVKLEQHTEDLADPRKVMQIMMEVSSEPYAFVEKRFPFRVRYRSLYDESGMQVIALEKYKKTTKTIHEISWIDQQRHQVLRFRPKGRNAGKRIFPVSLHPWMQNGTIFEFHKYAPIPAPENLLDYLSLLQRVRFLSFSKGDDYHFRVTDGKHLYDYRVSVENNRRIDIQGKKIKAWKLRFEGVEKGEKKPNHRPLFVWIQDNDNRTPLLFENRHPLGRFIVSLTSTIQ